MKRMHISKQTLHVFISAAVIQASVFACAEKWKLAEIRPG